LVGDKHNLTSLFGLADATLKQAKQSGADQVLSHVDLSNQDK